MADLLLLPILLIASIAGIFLFRLYSVLGRRTGHERPPQEGYQLGPHQTDDTPHKLNPRPTLVAPDRPTDPVASGLFDISLVDRGFDKDQFLKGAQAAYEMILTAFAAGDRDTLKPLLSDDVFAAFDAVIKRRETNAQKASLTLVGFSNVKMIAVALKASVADITLSFGTRLISATTDADGKAVEGSATTVQDVTDVWTFTRDVRARDPNWVLVATASEPL